MSPYPTFSSSSFFQSGWEIVTEDQEQHYGYYNSLFYLGPASVHGCFVFIIGNHVLNHLTWVCCLPCLCRAPSYLFRTIVRTPVFNELHYCVNRRDGIGNSISSMCSDLTRKYHSPLKRRESGQMQRQMSLGDTTPREMCHSQNHNDYELPCLWEPGVAKGLEAKYRMWWLEQGQEAGSYYVMGSEPVWESEHFWIWMLMMVAQLCECA